jgi:hypothetical protein
LPFTPIATDDSRPTLPAVSRRRIVWVPAQVWFEHARSFRSASVASR